MLSDLTQGKPAKVILIYSVPIIIGNLFQQLYNMVDTIVVGRFVGYEALAGVGATNGLSFLILGFCIGITSGLGIVIAQYFGAKDIEGLRRSIGTSFIICAVLSIVLTAVALLLTDPLLRWIQTPDSIFGYSHTYIVIIYAGIAAQVSYNMAACMLRAVGDSRTPLYFLIFSSVLNIGLDLLFILVFGMGVEGVAYATVISQFLSAVLCFVYAFSHYDVLSVSSSDFKSSLSFVWKHLRIGLPMAFQFSITAFGLILLQAALNDFPAEYIAGFTAANKVQNLGSLVAIAFGVAMANYAGQNYGAGDISRVRQGVNATLVMTLCVCVLSASLIALFADPLTSLFVDKKFVSLSAIDDIYFASRRYLYMSAAFFPFLFVIFVYRNALQGIGFLFWPLMGGVLELVIRSVGSIMLPRYLGYTGVTLIDVFAWVGAAVLLAVAYYVQMGKVPESSCFKSYSE